MFKILLSIISIFSLTNNAIAADYSKERENPEFYRIQELPITSSFETPFSDEEWLSFSLSDQCVQTGPAALPADPLEDSPGVTIDEIINIGRTIWQIIEAGKPKVTIKTAAAYALPKGVNCWSDLAGWQIPMVKNFNVKYINGMNITVAQFDYKVIYIYGGNFAGKGKYLAGIRILPKNVKVLWGFDLNANATVPNVVNSGTKRNPIGAAELELQWTVKSKINELTSNRTYFVKGNGEFTDLN